MIEHKYGKFSEDQIERYKKKLHSKIHWLLIYKDPATNGEYPNVDFQCYFFWLMKEIGGLNSLLKKPPEVVEILSLLQAARLESYREDFDFSKYRKLILDAHNLVDKIGGVRHDNGE